MKHPGVILLLVSWVATSGEENLRLPRLPSPHLARLEAAGPALSRDELRLALQALLPAGTVLVREEAAPGGPARDARAEQPRGEPELAVAKAGIRPVLDMADERYLPLSHDYIPVLADWFEALAASLELTPQEMRAHGFRSNKVARLLRVFTSIRVQRDRGPDPGAAPAIGWCRILLQEDWGRCRVGETHSFLLVGTERGWFVIDPFTRRMRPLAKDDPRWLVEFIVI